MTKAESEGGGGGEGEGATQTKKEKDSKKNKEDDGNGARKRRITEEDDRGGGKRRCIPPHQPAPNPPTQPTHQHGLRQRLAQRSRVERCDQVPHHDGVFGRGAEQRRLEGLVALGVGVTGGCGRVRVGVGNGVGNGVGVRREPGPG